MTIETLRTPGIRFEPLPPPPPEPLPRLDVAALVGFAARGPIDVPVAVEDVVRFHDIFGDDLPLAWDSERGEIVYAQLPSAARAFFRNGGRRCWIVRTAGTGAESAAFVMPGIIRVTGSPRRVVAVRARARSEGAWADTLAVGSTIVHQPLAPGSLTHAASPHGWTLDVRAAGARLNAGDLLQLTFDGGFISFFAIASVSKVNRALSGQLTVALAGREATFRIAALDSIWPGHPSPPPPSVTLLDGARNRSLSVYPWRPPVSSPAATSAAGFFVDRESAADIRPGAWILLRYGSPVGSPPSSELLLQVDEIAGGQVPAASPPGSADLWLVKASRGWWVLDTLAPAAVAPLAASVVTFDWLVRDGSGVVTRLSDLGFGRAHPRCWSALPDDRTLFAPLERPVTNSAEGLWREVERPRFPFAGPIAAEEGDALDIPLGMPGVIRDEFFQPPLHSQRRADERNGLDTFNASLFLDPRFDPVSSTAATFADDAFFIKYQGTSPQPLRRLHSIFDLPDATLIAVPDASHRPWRLSSEVATLIGAPDLTVDPPDPAGRYTLRWTTPPVGASVPVAFEYLLQESPDPRFATSREIRQLARTVTAVCPIAPCQRLFYRVRAVTGDGGGPWSATVEAPRAGSAFDPCSRPSLDPPVLTIKGPARGQYTLEWTGAGPGRTFVLELSSDPSFAASRPVYEGATPRFRIWAADELAYFRVGVETATDRSGWSNTVFDWRKAPLKGSQRRGSIGATATAHLPQLVDAPLPGLDTDATNRLQAVHIPLLRLCLARGDLLALLALPASARGEDASAYLTQLATRLDAEDERLLSFAAVYHPWPLVREANDAPLRLVSPDGLAAGVVARRAASGGGWLSPANQAWHGVAALEPALTRGEHDLLRRARVNLVVPGTRGFTTLSGDTLHAGLDWDEINLRLLAFLLRRLALRDGMTFAFQPNDLALRRLIQREFDRVLGDLYMRGAFAGLTRADAYRIVTDESVNTRESLEAGRCIVELRYAPSRPMAFLTVRLVQKGSGALVAEEVSGG